MAKTVLLARPHPFIVSEMRPFLDQGGFAVKKLDKFADLPANVAGLSGAIISLAVSSPISESAEAVFAEVRRLAPRVPALFASMLDFAEMKAALERLAKSSSIKATILGIDAASENHPDLGKPDMLLYLSKNDLSTPEQRALAAKIIQRHFR